MEVPITVNPDGEVIDGWHRVEARKRLGLLHVRVEPYNPADVGVDTVQPHGFGDIDGQV
jgi:hypothetical protein